MIWLIVAFLVLLVPFRLSNLLPIILCLWFIKLEHHPSSRRHRSANKSKSLPLESTATQSVAHRALRMCYIGGRSAAMFLAASIKTVRWLFVEIGRLIKRIYRRRYSSGGLRLRR